MDSHELRRLLALAGVFKEGDVSIGGTTDDRLRAEAQQALLATTVKEIHRTPIVDDGVTAALEQSRERRWDDDLAPLTVARLRDVLLGSGAAAWAQTYRNALPSEVIAAVAKVMTNEQLSTVARTVFNPLEPGAVGSARHFGSRIQPNSPGDDEQEIVFSILEGLSYGCGDVIIGLNPAADDLDTIIRLEHLLEQVVRRLELPTRYCVLSDIAKQHEARARARIDVGFQSLAGTSRGLRGMVGMDVDGVLDLAQAFDGLYFETGQGSEVTNGAADGVDMGTLEARSYGVARHIQQRSGHRWMIVNDVAGFIGPEVFRDANQLQRVCLEDAVMAKLHGLTMGLDVCATFHMGISPQELRQLTARAAANAAPAYLMSVAGNADPMLGYLTTSFREHAQLRGLVRRDITRPMRRRLTDLGVLSQDGTLTNQRDSAARLYAMYAKAGGDRRGLSSLEDDGREQLLALRTRGYDLGIANPAESDARLEAIYEHARSALYASLDAGLIEEATTRPLRVRTVAASRDHYLAQPAAGERLRDDDARAIAALYPTRSPYVQLVVSDGLNANAANEHLRMLLPELRHTLSGHYDVGDIDVVVQNGRVRAGYEIGGLVGAAIVVHIIGERPGTGMNMLSAYLTYGHDENGLLRWSRALDHAATTAVCGIHPGGKPPGAACSEIVRLVGRITEQRRSGVALTR